MADEREEWVASDEGQVRTVGGEFIASCWEKPGAFGPAGEVQRANKIAREHNLHPRLMEVCKMALDALCLGCSGFCLTQPPSECPKVFASGTAGLLREVIAEAEKE